MSIQNLKEKLCEFYNNLKKSFESYKVTYVAIVLVTLYSAVIDMSYDLKLELPFDEMIVVRVLCIFGVAAAFIETYFKEKSKAKIPAFAAAAVIACIAAYNLGLKKGEQLMNMSGDIIKDVTTRLLIGYLLLLMLGIVYYSFKKSGFSFEEYTLRIFSNLVKVYIFYFILIIGTLIIAEIFDALFIDGYSSLSDACLILVTGLYFAPQCLAALSDMRDTPGYFIKTIVKYVLSCMTICSMAIVYLYMLKIIIMFEIPSNEIFSIVSVLFCLGIPIWIVVGYYRDGTKYSKVLSVLPYVFAPLIILQIYSMGIRIYEHGMTNERYMGLMLIGFEIGTVIIWKLCKQKYEVLIKLLAIIIVVAVFVPVVNMESVSNIWQKAFLQKYYQAVIDGRDITDIEYERMMGAYSYLADKPQMKAVTDKYNVYEDQFVWAVGEHTTSTPKLTDYATHYVHCCQMVGDIDINEYKKFSMLNQDESYDKISSSSRADSKPGVDFSQFKFIVRETGEEIVVDISDFAEKCMEYEKEHPNTDKEIISAGMKQYNRIELDDGRILYINHFELRYNEGIKDGKDYFKWSTVNLGAMLLQK
ncbi:MAG: DUF4153 domain-containing protein [Lachnospiraceae bacterium]|nr:DUF4153 domain-containing protein [Lachnospiraceae bacterium]